jgi:uncharacterized protein YggE
MVKTVKEKIEREVNMNRKWMVTIGAIVVLLAAVAGLAGCNSEGTISGGTLEIKGILNSQQEGIWVSGEGKVTAVPDVAILNLGVQAQAASVADAQSQAAEAMDKVMTALKDGGVTEKDIQTQSFNIQQLTRYDDKTQQQVVIGYQVNNTVTAKIRDVDNAGEVIDAAAAEGGDLTRINSIGFTVDDPKPFQEQARQQAVADAAAKAKQLADTAGVKLGKPLYITESSYLPGPIYRDATMSAEGAPKVTTPVSPGEMEITVNVQIAYEID